MIFLLIFLLSLISSSLSHDHTVSKINLEKYSLPNDGDESPKFIIYDVNFGEGFNLRRDVYMRVANTVRQLREEGHNYILVLPPWGRLHHWKRMEVNLSWDHFFDVKSLKNFVPVIRFYDFYKLTKNVPIDWVLYLQHYAEGWGTEFVRKFDKRECNQKHHYSKEDKTTLWKGWFFSYEDVRARNVECISIQGDSSTLKDLILHANYTKSQSILIDRAETILHENYGDTEYWRARRSMRYSPTLTQAGDVFRRKHLDSDDVRDHTELPKDWREETGVRSAVGGPYIAIHWRRRDFLYARRDQLPSVEGTARILNNLTKKMKLNRVFLATDAPEEEVDELKSYLREDVQVFQFTETHEFNDGQIAIIDQYICAHAHYFIGSHESTFTFRIQEDREILGFPVESTFNRLCPDNSSDCEQPAKWKIVY